MALAHAADPGWAALADGLWLEARRHFAARLAEGESPEAFEGLSWAAWWLDDEALVFEARERAYALYRRSGDAASAGRMATWLAADEVDFHGAPAVAAGWLRRAHRLLDPLEAGPDHGWLAFHEGYLAHGAGDSEGARAAAIFAADVGRKFGSADLEMLGLALEGAALVAGAEVDAGMQRLDEATATALEGNATIPISGAWACCFLVSACTALRDHKRAYGWCDRIAAFAERFGSRYMLAFCRSEYGIVHLWRGDWAAADSMLAASVEDFSASRPAWVVAPLVTLAELRRRQGRMDEAATLLDEVGAGASAHTSRAWLALDAGETARAVELAQRALRRVPGSRRLARLPALEVLVRARIARGELSEAAETADELAHLCRLVGTAALRGAATLAAGMLAAARGEHERAVTSLEDALDDFQSVEAPYETARARVELALSLTALRRPEEAARETTTAVQAFRALGAEADAIRAQTVLDGIRAPSHPAVTKRERDVLRLLAEGLTNRQIAARLVVSEHTVHRHVTNILRKLGLPSRTAAAAHAVRTGLADEPD